MDLSDISEGASIALADELTMDILITFYYQNNTYLSFNAFLNQVLCKCFPLWPWASAPKAFCTRSSLPKQSLQLPKCPAAAVAQLRAPCHPREHGYIHPCSRQQEIRRCRPVLSCLEERLRVSRSHGHHVRSEF